MIPIRNAVPSRYPPVVTWLLIATNCLVFLLQNSLSTAELEQFLRDFALIPAHYTAALRYGAADLSIDDLLPFFTMMFLHGGWLHLILNMWTLWLFGPTVEDRLGHGPSGGRLDSFDCAAGAQYFHCSGYLSRDLCCMHFCGG